jgi:mono/diheme cytochrome c family protein
MKKQLVTLSLVLSLTQFIHAEELVDRGKYLVESVGMCQDCHTPRGKDGQYIKDKWMAGNILAFKPTVPMPVWAPTAPSIRDLPNYTDEQAIKLFTTGISRTGNPPRPPMPEFRFSEADAKAVVAYLRTLKPVE